MLCSGDCNVLWSVDALKGSFLSLPLENSSDASIHLKHKWLMMWCSAVVQLTPVQIYGGKTRGWDVCGNAFVVLTLCDCKWWTSQLQTTTEWGFATKKRKKRTWIIQSKYTNVWDPNASWERIVATFIFSPARWKYMKYWCQQAWINLF